MGNVDWGKYIAGGHCTDTCSSEGSQQIDMCGGSKGTISQDVATTAGSTYRLTFDYNAHASCGGNTKQMQVQVAGTTIATISKTRCGGWSSYDIKAAGASTTIVFAAVDSSCGCMTLDNVSVK